jgi:hypothetical protein
MVWPHVCHVWCVLQGRVRSNDSETGLPVVGTRFHEPHIPQKVFAPLVLRQLLEFASCNVAKKALPPSWEPFARFAAQPHCSRLVRVGAHSCTVTPSDSMEKQRPSLPCEGILWSETKTRHTLASLVVDSAHVAQLPIPSEVLLAVCASAVRVFAVSHAAGIAHGNVSLDSFHVTEDGGLLLDGWSDACMLFQIEPRDDWSLHVAQHCTLVPPEAASRALSNAIERLGGKECSDTDQECGSCDPELTDAYALGHSLSSLLTHCDATRSRRYRPRPILSDMARAVIRGDSAPESLATLSAERERLLDPEDQHPWYLAPDLARFPVDSRRRLTSSLIAESLGLAELRGLISALTHPDPKQRRSPRQLIQDMVVYSDLLAGKLIPAVPCRPGHMFPPASIVSDSNPVTWPHWRRNASAALLAGFRQFRVQAALKWIASQLVSDADTLETSSQPSAASLGSEDDDDDMTSQRGGRKERAPASGRRRFATPRDESRLSDRHSG